MALLESEYLLVHSLGKAEKRKVKLRAGKNREGKASDHMQLFDLLNGNDVYRAEYFQSHPLVQAWGKGISTISARLRRAILVAIWGQQSTGKEGVQWYLFATGFYQERGLLDLANKALEKGLLISETLGLYQETNAFLGIRREILFKRNEIPSQTTIDEMHASIRRNQEWLRVREEAEHARACIRSISKKELRPRGEKESQALIQILDDIGDLQERVGPDLYSRSLLRDGEGMALIITGKGPQAFEIYDELIKEWQRSPSWISQYSDFYLELFRHYQRSIYFGTIDADVFEGYLKVLPDVELFSNRHRLEFQRINYSHQLTLGLNFAQFEALFLTVPEVEKWLLDHTTTIDEGVQLAFRYNIVIAYFLTGEFRLAYQSLRWILQWKKGSAREDIREFSRVLEVILLFELQHHDLNEYVTRRNKRYFKQKSYQIEFEKAVVDFVARAIRSPEPNAVSEGMEMLEATILSLMQKTARPNPLLGLSETHIWIKSKMKEIPIREEFLQRIGHY